MALQPLSYQIRSMLSDSIRKMNQNDPEESQKITQQNEEKTHLHNRNSCLEYIIFQKCLEIDDWKPQ